MRRVLIFLLLFFTMLTGYVLSEVSEWGIKYQESDEAGGPEIIYTKPVKAVLFSHKLHVKDLGLPCESCHTSIFEMEAFKAQQNPDFNFETIHKNKYCAACHNGQVVYAATTKCATCHIGVKGLERLKKKAKS